MAAEKYLVLPASGNDPQQQAGTQTGGAANGGRIMALRDDGTIDPTMYGPEIASPDVETGVASEALAAGDLVNTFNNGGANGVRKAVNSSFGFRAMGFVVAAASQNATVTVYKSGAPNSQVSGLAVGQQWLSSTPGKSSATPPALTATGSVQQKVGYASAANMLHVKLEPAYTI